MVRTVRVELTMTDGDDVLLSFLVMPSDTLTVPAWETPAREDELWKNTCFELFLRAAGEDRYVEFNLSPSSRWASYAFEEYRAGMRDLPLSVEPQIETERRSSSFELTADLDLSEISGSDLYAGLSAVIEEIDGTRSYWALAHPPGKPDFHHPDCFALALPAPGVP